MAKRCVNKRRIQHFSGGECIEYTKNLKNMFIFMRKRWRKSAFL